MMRCPLDWEIYRRPDPWTGHDMGDRCNGHLYIPARQMVVIFSNGEGWEHVSVSHSDHTPSWETMAEIKRRFWDSQDCVMQLHVPELDHINCHPYCLHLWRPLEQEIPRPPGIMVAPKKNRPLTHERGEFMTNPNPSDSRPKEPMTTGDPGASAKCPLCGISKLHEHSATERVIYRNGQKAAISLLREPKAYLHPVTGHVLSAEKFKEHEEARTRQHQDPFYYVPLYELPVLP